MRWRHRIESRVCNKFQNTRTRQKEGGILCWRLLLHTHTHTPHTHTNTHTHTLSIFPTLSRVHFVHLSIDIHKRDRHTWTLSLFFFFFFFFLSQCACVCVCRFSLTSCQKIEIYPCLTQKWLVKRKAEQKIDLDLNLVFKKIYLKTNFWNFLANETVRLRYKYVISCCKETLMIR